MTNIRKATSADVSRIAEIIIFNNRINFFTIFKNEWYSFGELQVVSMADKIKNDENVLNSTFVYDDGVVKGLIQIIGAEVRKLYVDPCLQGQKIGDKLLNFAIQQHNVEWLWALEKNVKAIKFYNNHGFYATDEKKFEEGTTEYLVKLVRK